MRRSKREAARANAVARQQYHSERLIQRQQVQAERERKVAKYLKEDRSPEAVVRAEAQQMGVSAEFLNVVSKRAPRLLTSEYTRPLYYLSMFQWIRPLSDWKPAGKGRDTMFRSLAGYLVAKYPMPALLWGAFFEQRVEAESLLHVVEYVASGGSLFKLSKEGSFRVPLTRQMCHDLLTLPGDRFIEGVRMAQARAFGGSPALVRAWVTHRVGSSIRTRRDEEFWLTVLQWFCQQTGVRQYEDCPTRRDCQQGMLDHQQVHPLLDYIGYRWHEDNDFSMKGRTMTALMTAMEEWHTGLTRAKALNGKTYEPSGFKPLRYTLKDREGTIRSWKLQEVLTGKELAAEGRAMRHCVYSYGPSIEEKRVSIWSVTQDGERKLTVEVRNNEKAIVQVRGPSNRLATSSEAKILVRWANDNGLAIWPRVLN
jgi:hypothetical protein